MKVMHVTNAVGWSGGMEQMALLLSGLEERGFQNVLVCPPGSELIPKLSQTARSSAIPTEILPMFQDYDVLAACRLRKLARKHAADLVHAHHATAHAVALVALIFSAAPPLVVSRRVSFSPRKNPFSRWKYRSKRIDRYVVVSAAVKETLARGGVPESKIQVIYSAVNPQAFAARAPDLRLKEALGLSDGCPVVGKIANVASWKGQHIFLRAAKQCLSKNPRIIFLLAGKDTHTLEPLVRELGIESSVRMCGFRKDVPDILPLLDVSVNSSVEGEGLSGALRESLMQGVPVVASDVAGNRELLGGGATGLLARPGDPAELAEKILFALEHREQVRAMAGQGRRWVLENASVDKMVQSHADLYRSLRR